LKTVLIADDEKNIRSSLSTTFGLEGYSVETAPDGESALACVERGQVDLLVLDMQMPRLDGLGLLRELDKRGLRLPSIVLTAHGTIDKAVEAIRLGAFDFIEKPPHVERILLSAKNALRQADLEEENRELRSDQEGRYDMVGTGSRMRELFEQIQRTAPTLARVLILGENGTGKELIARALHRHSSRSAGPFVRVNCAAIPGELFESELFGHEKGAFTGATARRRGKFLRAHLGTLFLDEVAEIPLGLQSKLLRALESGEIEPVGSEKETRCDVRVLAATNREIEAAVERGEFRADLYYRLQVVTLKAPPLRERKEDIPLLVERFLDQICADNNIPARRLDATALTRLTRHDFPGNVRELRNLVERLLILTRDEVISAADVARHLPQTAGRAATVPTDAGNLRETMTRLEREVILAALERHRWQMTATAAELGLERSHLYKKVKALGIERPAGDA